MFAEFGLARDEDRQPCRDLSTIGFQDEPQEESIKIDCTRSPPARFELNDAQPGIAYSKTGKHFG